MLDWIFEGTANWIASIMTQLMDAVSGLFLDALGTDMTVMEEYFPFLVSAYSIVQYTAWMLLMLIVVWQLFRVFGGPLTEAESPLLLLARGSIFAILISFARPIFTLVLDVARAPYTALMDTSMDPGDFTFAGVEQSIRNGLATIVSMATVVGVILLIIMMIALAWNYFKLLLETVERYVMVGVLCYTSPLAYAMGASKATGRIFQAWCRMVGSQLLLLILNVWFLRGFNSSVGQFVANGGALTTGQGGIFLWLFCALAFLKIAQRCDSYLASLGLNVAQTGGSMGMEMLMAARLISGSTKGSVNTAGATFGGNAAKSAAGAAGVVSGITSQYKPNSFVRDAVVDGGARMGASGGIGFVGRVFGGIAARNGASLTSDSVASVTGRPPQVSGTIGGEIADRSLGNYMPHLAKGMPSMQFSGTRITGGHISTTAVSTDGRQATVDFYSMAQYEKPDTPFSVVAASDGSQWYQVASGDAMSAFYQAPAFTGVSSETGAVSAAFPGISEGTMLRQVDTGTMEASYADGSSGLWYSSAFFREPDAPHEIVQGADGLSWYAMKPHAEVPAFEGGEQAGAYDQAVFGQFMPGYHQPIAAVDGSRSADGILEVRHADGSGTAFYDHTVYQPPQGDYHVYADSKGGQWYAISGTASVDRRPVYENGAPIYDNGELRTYNVETVRYRTTPSKYGTPAVRPKSERKPPRRKQP